MKSILVAVIPILAGGGAEEVTPSSVYADVAVVLAERAELRAISSEEMFVADASLLERIQDCGSESACIANELRALQAQLGLIVVINRDVSPPLIALRLVDVNRGTEAGSNIAPLAPEDGPLSPALRARVRALLERAGYAASGRISVSVSPPGASVAIEGVDSPPGAGNVFVLPQGTYRVRVASADHRGIEREVAVESGRETKIEVALERETSIVESPWLWIAAGAAAVVGAAAIFLITRGSECVCIAAEGSECPPC